MDNKLYDALYTVENSADALSAILDSHFDKPDIDCDDSVTVYEFVRCYKFIKAHLTLTRDALHGAKEEMQEVL